MEIKWTFLIQDLFGFFSGSGSSNPSPVVDGESSIAHPLDILYEESFGDLRADKLPKANPIFISDGLFLKVDSCREDQAPLHRPVDKSGLNPGRTGFFHHVFRTLILTFPGAFKENPGITQKMCVSLS